MHTLVAQLHLVWSWKIELLGGGLHSELRLNLLVVLELLHRVGSHHGRLLQLIEVLRKVSDHLVKGGQGLNFLKALLIVIGFWY